MPKQKYAKLNILVHFAETHLVEKISGFKVDQKDIIKILTNLGFKIKKNKKILILTVPSWRPDIEQEIDIVEEIVRIKGYENINIIEPERNRSKQTLNFKQKLFRFLKRVTAHSSNVVSAVIMPVDQLDYFDESEDTRG